MSYKGLIATMAGYAAQNDGTWSGTKFVCTDSATRVEFGSKSMSIDSNGNLTNAKGQPIDVSALDPEEKLEIALVGLRRWSILGLRCLAMMTGVKKDVISEDVH